MPDEDDKPSISPFVMGDNQDGGAADLWRNAPYSFRLP